MRRRRFFDRRITRKLNPLLADALVRDFPHGPDDPRYDLDTAGFGVVRFAAGEPERWEKKEAYDAVAGRYGEIRRPGNGSV